MVYTALLYFYYSYLITRLYPSLLSNNETNAQSSVSEGIEQVAESLAALDQDEEDIMSDQISILTAMSEDEGEEEDESNISSSDWTDVEILQWGEWMPQKNHSAEVIQHNMNQKSLTTQDSDKYEDDHTSTQSTLSSQSTAEGLPNVKRDRGRPKKATHYWELAAMLGHVGSRCNLGADEKNTGNVNRAMKHFMIAVRSGDDMTLRNIKKLFMSGEVTKDDYARALRAHQAYVDEIKSVHRDKAAAFSNEYKYFNEGPVSIDEYTKTKVRS